MCIKFEGTGVYRNVENELNDSFYSYYYFYYSSAICYFSKQYNFIKISSEYYA